MANPLFENNRNSSKGGGIFGLVYDWMYNSNPQFRDFANSMKGKSIDQAFAEKGLNYNDYKNMSDEDIIALMRKNGMFNS